ncbi:MAG: hypothetical protein KDE48_00580 [Anaerolineales bacterium]|nr:hypothetical protein [Anaerolineales bacterium]
MKRQTIWTFIFLICFSVILLNNFRQHALPLLAKSISSDGSWIEISPGSTTGGGISDNSGNSTWPAAAMAPDNTLYVAWDDTSSGDREIYVRKWNGSNWQEVSAGSASGGGISNNEGESRGVALAIDHSGMPYATWHDSSSGNYEIYVRRWNGNFWEEVGFGSATGGGISNSEGLSYWPSIAFASDGVPFIAWNDNSSGHHEIYVRRFNGTGWSEVGTNSASQGGISNTPGDSWSPEIEFLPDGRPLIAWNNGNANLKGEIYVKQWDGLSWTAFGENSASGGGISNTPGDSQVPAMEITPANIIYLSWQEGLLDGSSQVYVKKWDGNSWVDVGTDSASGGGISNNTGETWWPTLALGLNGVPYIAWYDNSGGQYQIYVRRWDGSHWSEVGPHSATNGGISNNIGISGIGEIVVDSQNIPYVIWEDASNGNYEVYGRRWQAPPCYELTTSHTGSGSDPVAAQSESVDCSSGEYEAGEVVGVTADPANGWEISGWEGTNNDSSSSTSNTVTMPANDHSIRVDYEQIMLSTSHSYLSLVLTKPTFFLGPEEHEPNDHPNVANGSLISDNTYFGTFTLTNDLDVDDYFYVNFPLNGHLSISLTDIPAGQDYNLVLYDETSTNILGYSGNVGDVNEFIFAEIKSGKNYIRVYNQSNSASSKPYKLTVTYE